ncbi:transglutaminase-like cysteine peptidase [Sphingomonas sp. ASV193]|uniref:transglutaminase-like cysteine peptidase n=1 Tax=Sphingomonas sp. ASV193 TaxID=3144405 RepID=UPI0032E85AE5
MTFRCAAIFLPALALFAGTAPADAETAASIPDPIVVTGRHGPDVLGTATLSAGVTVYNARIGRLGREPLGNPAIEALAMPLRGLSPDAMVAGAMREVRARVRFTTNIDSAAVSSYWNEASDTLRRGIGDSDDIAIVEMQVLRAAGFDQDQLWLSVGRHRLLGAHTVLFVHTPSGYRMLDASETAPIDVTGTAPTRFRPIVSIGFGGAFVHGIRYTAR